MTGQDVDHGDTGQDYAGQGTVGRDYGRRDSARHAVTDPAGNRDRLVAGPAHGTGDTGDLAAESAARPGETGVVDPARMEPADQPADYVRGPAGLTGAPDDLGREPTGAPDDPGRDPSGAAAVPGAAAAPGNGVVPRDAGRTAVPGGVGSEPAALAGTPGNLGREPVDLTAQPENLAGTPVPASRQGAGQADIDPAGNGPLVDDQAQVQQTWQEIQATFVDDPRGSVTRAADLADVVVQNLLTTAEERKRALRGIWDAGQADTEDLRNALRGYRVFIDRLSGV